MKRIILLLIAFSCLGVCQARKGYDREIKSTLFVPKRTWTGGLNVSYLEMEGDDYGFFMLDNLTGKGYTFKISPNFHYFFKDNMSVGIRASYKRSYFDLGSMNIDLGDDLNFEISDYSYLEHGINSTVFLRTYMSLGKSKIFGFFNELSLTYGFSQGKTKSGTGKDMIGMYQKTNRMQIGCTPGLTAFVTNNLAVEVSVDVLGLDFRWINQTRNQVEKASFRKSSADFNINIFSINLGICTYF